MSKCQKEVLTQQRLKRIVPVPAQGPTPCQKEVLTQQRLKLQVMC